MRAGRYALVAPIELQCIFAMSKKNAYPENCKIVVHIFLYSFSMHKLQCVFYMCICYVKLQCIFAMSKKNAI